MLPTQVKQWDKSKIKQFNQQNEEALLSDEQTLLSFSQDFGKLMQSQPSAVYIPKNLAAIESLIQFAQYESLPITIRGNGLSQGGQSLPVDGGISLSMQHFNKTLELADDTIWVEANSNWSDLVKVSLTAGKAPFVLPYNCNLSIAGVLSVGGVGASSFKYGIMNAHVQALEVIDGLGQRQIVDKSSPLFHACLSGQGRFGVITKAQIKLRNVKPMIKTFSLVYADQGQWLADIQKLKQRADYMELFCSPSLQGTKLEKGKRVPMAQWLYGLHFSLEYEGEEPDYQSIAADLKPFNTINTQMEPIGSYYLRHDSRFEVMKMLGQWDLIHPWYECFIPGEVLQANLSSLLQDLPLHYASFVHVVPVNRPKEDFLMYPDSETIYSFMILNPGVPAVLKDSCLQAIQELDKRLLQQGGKRYLSGFIGDGLNNGYWIKHFASQYKDWVELKKQYDPAGIFGSLLHPN